MEKVVDEDVNDILSKLSDADSLLTAVFRDNRVSWYQKVSILDFIGAKDDVGDSDSTEALHVSKSSSSHHILLHCLLLQHSPG